MSFRSFAWVGVLALGVFGCSAAPDQEESTSIDGQPLSAAPGGICAVACMAPPPGCSYRGGLYTGPCNAVNCGHLVCAPSGNECPVIDCAAPPPGCHYEGMVLSPCNQQTCGTLVCDGTTL